VPHACEGTRAGGMARHGAGVLAQYRPFAHARTRAPHAPMGWPPRARWRRRRPRTRWRWHGAACRARPRRTATAARAGAPNGRPALQRPGRPPMTRPRLLCWRAHPAAGQRLRLLMSAGAGPCWRLCRRLRMRRRERCCIQQAGRGVAFRALPAGGGTCPWGGDDGTGVVRSATEHNVQRASHVHVRACAAAGPSPSSITSRQAGSSSRLARRWPAILLRYSGTHEEDEETTSHRGAICPATPLDLVAWLPQRRDELMGPKRSRSADLAPPVALALCPVWPPPFSAKLT
jgi:hypothetical protein